MKIEYPDEWFDEEEKEQTPFRISRFIQEWQRDNDFVFTRFKNDKHDQMVIEKNIPFHSICAHHLFLFEGNAHIGYLPNKHICGLSKLARTVDKFSHRAQLQERLTDQIADYLEEKLESKGVMVVMEAKHYCMEARGVKKHGTVTVTSALRGVFKTDSTAKSEFLSLIKN